MAKSFFFFQAEDGIRDYKVTGVQTCALPISRARQGRDAQVAHGGPQGQCRDLRVPGPLRRLRRLRTMKKAARGRLFCGWSREGSRSEERRVGEEGRSRWSAYH